MISGALELNLMSFDTRTKGAWIVHHTNKLNQVSHPLEYETVLTAGKAGILLSGLSADEQLVLSAEKVEAIRKAAGILKMELPELFRSLSSVGVINVSGSYWIPGSWT